MKINPFNFFGKHKLLSLALCAALSGYQKTQAHPTQGKIPQKHVIGTRFGAGLFASVNIVLNHISWCEDNNKIPVVYWDNQSPYSPHYRYNEPNTNNENVWEYYFEPVSHLSYQPGDITHNDDPGEKYRFNYLAIDQPTRNKAYQLIHKYIKIKSSIQEKIDNFYQQNMVGEKTIGIHLRGTDKITEEQLVAPEAIVACALKYADNDTQFLIACDDQFLFNRMDAALQGHKVIHYNCYRSVNGHPLHQPYNRGANIVQSAIDAPPHAQLGEDVLVEASLLAQCDLLVHSSSGVSTAALYFNPQMPNILAR